jgi:TatD DNase family protein
VVHSFTGTMEEMKLMTSLPELFIGINGCSLRTDESVEVVKQIPLDRLLLETGI